MTHAALPSAGPQKQIPFRRLVTEGSSDALMPMGGGRFRAGETSDEIAFPAVASDGVQELQVLSPPLPVAKFKRVVASTRSREELAAFVAARF